MSVQFGAGQGQIAAPEVQDNSSIWLAANAIGIKPRDRRNRTATQQADTF
ncbi:hypothetical protein [Bradyrhizobium elkanii]|nr:hypothetical protein [Bradyrhizobium elkanii]